MLGSIVGTNVLNVEPSSWIKSQNYVNYQRTRPWCCNIFRQHRYTPAQRKNEKPYYTAACNRSRTSTTKKWKTILHGCMQ